MKKVYLILIGFFIVFISFQQKSSPNPLKFIEPNNSLEIVSIDNKCGEWGGNEHKITIYRENTEGPLLADYIEKEKNCKNKRETKITISVKKIELGASERELILQSINELTEKKLNREKFISHSGIYNRIMLRDSSIIIHDFPSIELKKLNELISKLKKNK